MANYLAVDLGGTKTLCQLSNAQGQILHKRQIASAGFDGIEPLLSAFLAEADVGQNVILACIAVAGPVNGARAQVTNLPWEIDAVQLAQQLGLQQVILCNDFAAVGHGIAALTADELLVLQQGDPDVSAPRAVIGAGTGLGQAILVPTVDSGWQVLATEGGHVDFAPNDARQALLRQHLATRYGHVSYERIVSGAGLSTLYTFIRDYEQREENPKLRLAMLEQDAAAVISEYALQHGDPLAQEALDLFVSIYGAQAGNLALNSLPRGGLYLAGGIAAKNRAWFENGGFIDAFLDKGRMRPLMEQIPVYLVLQPEVGLKGAEIMARKALYNESYDGKK